MDFFFLLMKILKFPNAEAAFQAFKCHDNQKDVEKFLTCVNPRKAKGDNTLMQKLDFLFKNSICIKHHLKGQKLDLAKQKRINIT